MPNSSRMQWPYPAKDSDPWFAKFDSMVAAIDSSGYAHREDRSIRLTGGGTASFDATTGQVNWTEVIEILSPIAGFKVTIPVPTTTPVLEDGEVLYVNLPRSPSQNVTVSHSVGSQLPNTDSAVALIVRSGLAVYWANGAKVADGEAKSLFGGTAAGTQFLEVINLGNRMSHGATTPLVVGRARARGRPRPSHGAA